MSASAAAPCCSYLGYRDFFPPLSAKGRHGVMTYREKSWKWLKIKCDSKNCSHLANGAVWCQSRPGQSGRCGCVRQHRSRWFVFDMEMHEDFKVASKDMRVQGGKHWSFSETYLSYPALLGQNTRLCFRVWQL